MLLLLVVFVCCWLLYVGCWLLLVVCCLFVVVGCGWRLPLSSFGACCCYVALFVVGVRVNAVAVCRLLVGVVVRPWLS